MSFYDMIDAFKGFSFEEYFKSITDADIERILQKDHIERLEYLALLSPKAEKHIELMAKKANEISVRHFGRTILLYTPMYLANYCVNKCKYCSFNVCNSITRKRLSMNEVEREAEIIAAAGLKHILILTGESKKETPVSYIASAVKVLKKYFDSISIEIYPLTVEEYREVFEAGADGVTVYQEVYDMTIYDEVHISGPKKDYLFRLDTPERACMAGARSVNIGALLGLGEFSREAFFTGIHAEYLQKKYGDVEISVSFPRIRPHKGHFDEVYIVNDLNLVQAMLAFRIFINHAGITISTRERGEFRDNIIPLGVTKMSAGVSTEVGGRTAENKSEGQFEISDTRSVDEMKKAILANGYQPIMKDWLNIEESLYERI